MPLCFVSKGFIMRIVKLGNVPGDEIGKGTCHNCKTVIECYKKECTKSYYDQRDACWNYSVTCPVCKNSMGVHFERN